MRLLFSFPLALFVYSNIWSFAYGQCEQLLTAEDGQAGDRFGENVWISGDRAIIAAPGAGKAGAVYIYHLKAARWQLKRRFDYEFSPDDWFGRAVTIDGDWAIVGVPGYGGGAGAAWTYWYNGREWIDATTSQLALSSIVEFNGTSVAKRGQWGIIGSAPYGCEGHAFVWQMDDQVSSTQTLVASDYFYEDHFGEEVAISDEWLFIGSSQGPYVFQETPLGWEELQHFNFLSIHSLPMAVLPSTATCGTTPLESTQVSSMRSIIMTENG